MKRILIVLGFSLMLFGLAHGSEIMMVSFTCPIDSTTFESGVQVSCYIVGQMLDLEPFGAVAAPAPLPVCPKDHFVVYADSIPADVIAKLKPYVLSSAYQDLVEGNSSYYLLAKLAEFLGIPPLQIGYQYLQASWQVADDPDRHREYVGECLNALLAGIPHANGAADDSLTIEILCVDLQRQLGRFADAHARLLPLLENQQMPDHVKSVAKYEMDLVAAQDTLRHEAPEAGSK